MILTILSVTLGIWLASSEPTRMNSDGLLLRQATAAPQPEAERLRALFRESDESYLRRNPIAAMFRGDLRYADRLGSNCTDATSRPRRLRQKRTSVHSRRSTGEA